MKKQLEIKPNKLNFFRVRQPKRPPPHFAYIHIPQRYNLESTIQRWIYDNLKGRFFVGKALHVDKSNKIADALKIGFEEPKELSYFTLACPHLKY